MRSSEIQEIIEEHRGMFEILERYDQTHELPTDRVRLDITLSRKTVEKLRKLKEETGKGISEIIEEAVTALGERPMD